MNTLHFKTPPERRWVLVFKMNLASAFSALIKKLMPLDTKMLYETSNCDDEVEDEDAFRKLPEDVVDSIVSFLSLKDLVKMSLVSKSWRYRWKTCPNLDLDLDIIYPEEETSLRPSSKRKQLGYAKQVNHILASHQGGSIEFFRIRSTLHNEYNAYADKWIMFALQKQAKSLVLIDMPKFEDEHGHVSCNYTLPPWFSLKDAMFMKHLNLGNICLGPFELSGSNHLTSLTLDNVFISDTWVHDTLQNCIHLRRLAFLRCTSLSISNLVIPQHLQLEHLSLFDGLKYLREVEIKVGQNLESFECHSNIIKGFSFEKLRNLKRLSLLASSSSSSFDTSDYVMTRLGLDVPSLERFHLGLNNNFPAKNYSRGNLATFSQLRFLSLSGFQVSQMAPFTKYVGFLLKMSPVLHTLELLGSFMSAQNEQQLTNGSSDGETHQNLKLVKLHGFEYCETAVDLVVYLLGISVNLETIQIDRRKQSYMGNDIWTDDAKQEFKSSPDVISEWLSTRISSSAKLVVL